MLIIGSKHHILNLLLTAYRKHLKSCKPIHNTVTLLWRICATKIMRLRAFLFVVLHKDASRWRRLISLTELVQKKGLISHKLLDSEQVVTPAPRVFSTEDNNYLQSPHDYYVFPEISVTLVPNAIVCGGSNFLLTDDVVVCHDLFNIVTDETSEELHGRIKTDPKRRRVRWLAHDNIQTKLPVAASFLDACASNYAHWLTEVFPRIVLFCAQERYQGIPIIVNDGLHENIMESLYRVLEPDREIIKLANGKSLTIDSLYTISLAGYVPFEPRVTNVSGLSHGKFSPYALNKLASSFDSSADIPFDRQWPEKIFIRRNSGSRKVLNATDLEKLLESQGYVIVEPEKLTFFEQVQLFRNAEAVIGSSGAALANIIFCRPGTKITILMSRYLGTSYWYWQNIACATGKTVSYILGDPLAVGTKPVGIHSDFMIQLNKFVY